jgi:hypothetical protein
MGNAMNIAIPIGSLAVRPYYAALDSGVNISFRSA